MQKPFAPAHSARATGTGSKKEATKVLSAQSTVVKRPLAQNDRQLTSMVPAALRVKREQAAEAKGEKAAAPGFGLAPQLNPSVVPRPAPAPSKDDDFLNFMEEMQEMGAISK